LAHCNYFAGCGNRGIDRVIGAYCDCAMAIFLFLSGYGLYQSYKMNGLNRYVRKKVINVLYPVVVTMIIQAIIKQCFWKAGLNSIRQYILCFQLLGLKPEI